MKKIEGPMVSVSRLRILRSLVASLVFIGGALHRGRVWFFGEVSYAPSTVGGWFRNRFNGITLTIFDL